MLPIFYIKRLGINWNDQKQKYNLETETEMLVVKNENSTTKNC